MSQVAQIIAQQIGSRAFLMLGASNLIGGENYLSFRIKGCPTINTIKVTLNPMDTYDMEFQKVTRRGVDVRVKVVAEVNGVYFDQLCDVIESRTGLYTSI